MRWMRTAVHEDLAPDVGTAFVDHEDAFLLRQLNELRGKGRAHRSRSAGRKAQTFGIVLALIQAVVVVNGRRPRLKRDERLLGCTASKCTVKVLRGLARVSGEILNGRQSPNAFLRTIASEVDRAIF